MTLLIGIDPGVNTGIAVYDVANKSLLLHTMKIHQAFDKVRELKAHIKYIVIENPNLWTHFSSFTQAAAQRQGAGSVKRDYSAWRDFLTDERIGYMDMKPDKTRNQMATDEILFRSITKYAGKCSEHARVAAMLVWERD